MFKIYRQVLFWFDVSQAYDQYKVRKFPIFIWSFGRWPGDFVYGFPAIDARDGGLKIASEEYEVTTRLSRSTGVLPLKSRLASSRITFRENSGE
jgi:hypothetical protein